MNIKVILKVGMLFFCAGVSAHDGTVNITGTIQDNACIITPDSVNQTVPLGTIASKDLREVGNVTRVERFTIRLEQCGAAASGATVTFSGVPDNIDPTLVKLTAETGSATGLGVELLDNGLQTIPVQSSSHQYPIEPGALSAELIFYARYKATASKVTAGVANASVTFTITYA